MTPPDTNLQKQKKRHRGPLIGIALVVIFGFGLIAYWVVEEAAVAPGPDDAPAPRPMRRPPSAGGRGVLPSNLAGVHGSTPVVKHTARWECRDNADDNSH